MTCHVNTEDFIQPVLNLNKRKNTFSLICIAVSQYFGHMPGKLAETGDGGNGNFKF